MTNTAPELNPQSEFAQDNLKSNIDNDAVPSVLHWLPTAFLISVVGIGLALTLITPAIWNKLPNKSVLDGRWQSDFEHNYDQLHPIKTLGVDSFGLANYTLFKEGRPGVLVGLNNWLYTTEEFYTAPDDMIQIRAKLNEISRVRRSLASENTELIILLVPAKSRIYPEYLGHHTWPVIKKAEYENFRAQLIAEGILAPDLRKTFLASKQQGELFLHTDTHWTPLGAKVAASVVEKAIKDMFPSPNLPVNTFEMQMGKSSTYSGDLIKYIPLGSYQQLGPSPDQLITPSVQRNDSTAGLFGNDSPAVTLVGTSYSANQHWGFEGFLKLALGTDLINAAQEGKGPMIPMREYMSSKNYRDSPPKVVIWEIPERFLNVKY